MTRTRSPSTAVLLSLLLLCAIALPGCGDDADEAGAAGGADAAVEGGRMGAVDDTATIRVDDAGFATPESVLYDDRADVYLVSNINGAPLARDDNGFISRVTADGQVDSLRWIDGGGSADVRLSAPKGMAFKGDTLFVTDIDTVRAFHRQTGQPLGSRGVPGATFLNDLAVGPDGTLYVSDSGLNASFSSTGTDAVHAFRGDRPTPVVQGSELAGPNGIVLAGDTLLFVTFGASEVRAVATAGGGAGAAAASLRTAAPLPGGQLDGIVRLDDGSLLVSSWESQAVYRVPSGGGEPRPVVEGVPSPADIGWDSRRRRVLIPVFQENRLELRPVR